MAVWGLTAAGYSPYAGAAQLKGAAVFLNDIKPPSVTTPVVSTSATPQNGWSRTGTVTIGANSYDLGLGLKSQTLSYYGTTGSYVDAATATSSCTGDRNHRCPNTAYTSFAPVAIASIGDGVNNVYVRATDIVGNNAVSPGAAPLKIDKTAPKISTSGELWAARDRNDDRRYAGVYKAQPTFTASATDAVSGGPTTSGVARVDVKVLNAAGSTVKTYDDPSPRTTVCDSCPKDVPAPMDLSSLPDGVYTVSAVATDLAGNVSGATTFTFTLDLAGDLLHAKAMTSDPASGGQPAEEAWLRSGGVEERVVDEDAVSTRRTVPCSSAFNPSPSCVQTTVTVAGTTSTIQGSGPADPRVPEIYDLASSNLLDGLTAGDQGSLDSVMQPWQHGPPARSDTFTHYSGHDDDGDTDVWVDSVTKLPVHTKVRYSDGTTSELWIDYDVGRTDVASTPPGFFGDVSPTGPVGSETRTLNGSSALGSLIDPDTGSQFASYFLGLAPQLLGQPLCLLTSETVTSQIDASDVGTVFEGEAADPAGPSKVSNSYYKQGSCGSGGPGSGTLETVDLIVANTAAGSQTAAA